MDNLKPELQNLTLPQAIQFWDALEKKYGIQAVRELCRIDRFYLLARVCGRVDTLHPWIYQQCRMVEAQPDNMLDLWGREHFKSSLITFAGSIQEILRDPEITIAIFSHTKGIARKFFRQIKYELESNDTLKRAFPDVLYQNPSKEAPRWAEETGLVVKRKSNPKEATLESWGLVDGQPTSAHFKLRIYDDVVAPESVTTPEQIQKTTAAWELSDNLGTADGRKWHVGTRYHFGDTYNAIIERGALQVRLRPATDNGQPDGNPVLLSPEQWAEKKLIQGPATIACHCAGTTVLMADWTYKSIEDVQIGDDVVGYEFGAKTTLVRTKVIAINSRIARASRYTLESGNTTECTPDHKWWTQRSGQDGHKQYSQLGRLGKSDLKRLYRISNDYAEDKNPKWQYLAGIMDGEGTVSGNRLVITQSEAHNPEVHARIAETLDSLGFKYSKYEREAHELSGKKSKGSTLFLINGGRHERHRFLLNAKPAKNKAIIDSLYCCIGGKTSAYEDKVISCEDIGDRVVYNIQTVTGNYIANGYASKNCQMLQNPIAGQQAMFDVTDLQEYEVRPATLNVYILVDPARSMKKGSANTAIAVIGVDSARNKYLLDGLNHRMDLKRRWEAVRGMRKEWIGKPGVQMVWVGYEAFGAQADLDYFYEQMQVENSSFVIDELKWPRDGEGSKDDRVQRLGPDLRSHKFFVPKHSEHLTSNQARCKDAGQSYRIAKAIRKKDSDGNIYDLSVMLKEQIMFYPFAPLKDLIDAVSRIYDMEPKPPIIIDEAELEPEAFND